MIERLVGTAIVLFHLVLIAREQRVQLREATA